MATWALCAATNHSEWFGERFRHGEGEGAHLSHAAGPFVESEGSEFTRNQEMTPVSAT